MAEKLEVPAAMYTAGVRAGADKMINEKERKPQLEPAPDTAALDVAREKTREEEIGEAPIRSVLLGIVIAAGSAYAFDPNMTCLSPGSAAACKLEKTVHANRTDFYEADAGATDFYEANVSQCKPPTCSSAAVTFPPASVSTSITVRGANAGGGATIIGILNCPKGVVMNASGNGPVALARASSRSNVASKHVAFAERMGGVAALSVRVVDAADCRAVAGMQVDRPLGPGANAIERPKTRSLLLSKDMGPFTRTLPPLGPGENEVPRRAGWAIANHTSGVFGSETSMQGPAEDEQN